MNEVCETYFGWLTSLIAVKETDPEYDICRYLYEIKYRWRFILDKNRALAGTNLRKEYMNISGTTPDEMPEGDCTVLEMVIALAQRFAENADISVPRAYDEICYNLRIMPEQLGINSFKIVKDRVNRWMDGDQDFRAYPGPFPLFKYNGDARNIDLWSLMNAYIGENYPLNKDWLK